jgi:hypothetical protein
MHSALHIPRFLFRTPPAAGGVLLLAAAVIFLFVLLPPIFAHEPALDSYDWIFDKSYYTNKPNSSHRVWQYSPGYTPYRDPNAVFDSSHDSYPFEPQGYDPYPYYYNPYYSPWMYPGSFLGNGWYYGWNVNQYNLYDGEEYD